MYMSVRTFFVCTRTTRLAHSHAAIIWCGHDVRITHLALTSNYARAGSVGVADYWAIMTRFVISLRGKAITGSLAEAADRGGWLAGRQSQWQDLPASCIKNARESIYRNRACGYSVQMFRCARCERRGCYH